MSDPINNLNRALLMGLGCSPETANVIVTHIEDLRAENKQLRRFNDSCKCYNDYLRKAHDVLRQIAKYPVDAQQAASEYLKTVLCPGCGNYLNGFGECGPCNRRAQEERMNLME